MSGKYCFVLSCLNNSKKNPDKHYFRVPYNKDMRSQWCEAVDRAPTSLKQSSTAYCCSDHFDNNDFWIFVGSGETTPKLKDGAIPSLRIYDSPSHHTEPMDVVEDIFGTDDGALATNENQSGGRYIREVVYIEENDNSQFLQENVESEINFLSDLPDDVSPNFASKAVVEISDDEELLGAVASAIKTLKPTENTLVNKTSHEKNVSTANTTKQKPFSKNTMPLNNKSSKIIK